MKKLKLLVPILFLTIISCSKTDDLLFPLDDDLEGNFEFAISGSENRSLTGTATFVHGILKSDSEDKNGSTLTLSLYGDAEDTEVITILINQIGDLDGINEGSYTINLDQDKDHPYVNAVAYLETSMTPFIGGSGEVTIMKRVDQTITGSISVSMDNRNGDIIKISGDFTALGITQTI